MTIKITGLKEAQDKLKKLAQNAEKLDGQQVGSSELFTDKFISNCSSFNTFDALIAASGFKIKSKEDFETIPSEDWDVHIKENTNFSGWEEMKQSAAAKFARKQLGL